MKIKLFILLLLVTTSIYSQKRNYRIEYSFKVEIIDESLENKLKENPEFQFSKMFTVFYIENGTLRFIEKSNNFIQSSVFNNNKNKLVIFDRTGILSKNTGEFNKPIIKSKKSISNDVIIYKTKTGTYNYFFDSKKMKFDHSNISNLGEHCFNTFINDTGVLPEKLVFELGDIRLVVELKSFIILNQKEINFLKKVVNKPTKKRIKGFIEFIKKDLIR